MSPPDLLSKEMNTEAEKVKREKCICEDNNEYQGG
jgi:hypothetical protein